MYDAYDIALMLMAIAFSILLIFITSKEPRHPVPYGKLFWRSLVALLTITLLIVAGADFQQAILYISSLISANFSCDGEFIGLCLEKAKKSEYIFFSFSEYIGAFAVIAILYQISSPRHRFRVNVASINIKGVAFVACVTVGIFVLLADTAYSSAIILPAFMNHHTTIQLLLAAPMLGIILAWLYYAYTPAKYKHNNYKKFTEEVFDYLQRGASKELHDIASELRYSIKDIIRHSKTYSNIAHEHPTNKDKSHEDIGSYAYDLLQIIGNRKFCQHIISTSSDTATKLFSETSDLKKYDLPIGDFAQYLTEEALKNKDSNIYHENDKYRGGAIGYIKEFSKAIYGDPNIIEALHRDHKSPFDLNSDFKRSLDSQQLKAYCDLILIFANAYLIQESDKPSRALHSILSNLGDGLYEIEELNNTSKRHYEIDEYRKLQDIIDFIRDLRTLLDKHKKAPIEACNNENVLSYDTYDAVANLMFGVVKAVSRLRRDDDNFWFIHYSLVWDNFFRWGCYSEAGKALQHKLTNLILDEITRYEHLNHLSAPLLHYCLNIAGIHFDNPSEIETALGKKIVEWSIDNYRKIYEKNPDMAEKYMFGSLSYDVEKNRFIKTYDCGSKKYLKLKPYVTD